MVRCGAVWCSPVWCSAVWCCAARMAARPHDSAILSHRWSTSTAAAPTATDPITKSHAVAATRSGGTAATLVSGAPIVTYSTDAMNLSRANDPTEPGISDPTEPGNSDPTEPGNSDFTRRPEPDLQPTAERWRGRAASGVPLRSLSVRVWDVDLRLDLMPQRVGADSAAPMASWQREGGARWNRVVRRVGERYVHLDGLAADSNYLVQVASMTASPGSSHTYPEVLPRSGEVLRGNGEAVQVYCEQRYNVNRESFTCKQACYWQL